MRALLLALALAAAALAQEDEVAFTISGEVVSWDGEPRAGAAVQAWDEDGAFLAEAASGEDGAFRIVLLREDVLRREHPYGRVRLLVRAEGAADLEVAARAGETGVALRLARAREVRGRVLDHEGEPLAGAIVRAGLEQTTSDETGAFVLERLPDRALAVEAVHDGTRIRAGLAAGETTIELRAPAAPYRRGRVTDAATGLPVAGARLYAWDQFVAETDAEGRFELRLDPEETLHAVAPGYAPAEGTVLSPVPPFRGRVVDEADEPLDGCRVLFPGVRTPPVRTAEDGRFEFLSPPLGVHALVVERAGFVPQSLRVESGRGAVTVRLYRGAPLAGVVRSDGEPAMGALVRFFAEPDASPLAIAYTDGEGRFLAAGVPREARWADAVWGPRRSPAAALDRRPLLLDVRETLPFRGIVRSDAGHALAGALCVHGSRAIRTDAAGRFDFGEIAVLQVHDLEVQAEEHAEVRLECDLRFPVEIVMPSRFGDCALVVNVTPPGRAEVTVERREEPRVRRTEDFRHLPPGVYDVTVRRPRFLEVKRTVELKEGECTLAVDLQRGGTLELAASPGATVVVQTVAGEPAPVAVLELDEGARTLEGFGPGTYRFIARAKGELIVVREVELRPDAPPVALDLHGGKESELVVEVRDAAGAPVADAEITLATEGGFEWNTRKRTGEDGRVTLTRLIRGPLEVRARRGNRAAAALVEIAPARQLTATLEMR